MVGVLGTLGLSEEPDLETKCDLVIITRFNDYCLKWFTYIVSILTVTLRIGIITFILQMTKLTHGILNNDPNVTKMLSHRVKI